MSVENGIGASVRRKEDQRFITGNGRYLDDMNKVGQAYGYFLRSPHAFAKINNIDLTAAKAAPGVVDIFTGADMAADGIGGLICGWGITSKDGSPHNAPPHNSMAVDAVRHVGDQVAFVIAETLQQAKDAAELIEVDYETMTPVTNIAKALAPGAPQIHEEAPGNLCYDWELGDKAAVDSAFSNAAHVSKIDLVNNRLSPNPMEPRAALGEFDPGSGELTLYTTSQNPHVARLIMSAFLGIAPENKLRVVAPDVGGGFGSKIFVYAEETTTIWAARKINRPVKWTADRSEAFLTDAHGRDHVTHAELAMDNDGNIQAFRV
ncbi:molybdopterin cofactor-binding domain-containing protein, partial [uncultured Sneathiella sp.]|uniref:xanthine dehydrogenase family protein molybdopterin-binding subunit n=1 Tax=uncultured Sneathiella sp. TaxID=879315 RepID=UPI0030DC1CB0